MVDSALEPDRIHRYFLLISGNLRLASAPLTFSMIGPVGSHGSGFAYIINETILLHFQYTLFVHLMIEMTFEFPALGQPRKMSR
jgi:hypothetical protein